VCRDAQDRLHTIAAFAAPPAATEGDEEDQQSQTNERQVDDAASLHFGHVACL
jgi:hypothetical protein